MSSVKELLTYTAKMFKDNPEKWGQGAFAKTKHGGYARPHGDDAATFCLHGGLMRAEFELGSPNDSRVLAAHHQVEALLKEYTKGQSPIRWNDEEGRTVDEVVCVLEKAANRVGD